MVKANCGNSAIPLNNVLPHIQWGKRKRKMKMRKRKRVKGKKRKN